MPRPGTPWATTRSWSRKALKSYGGSTDEVVVATKGGITRSEGESSGRDGSLDYLRSAVEKSLRRLGVDVIDLYQWHRPDRWQVYGDVIGHFKTLQEEGKIKAIGISNANVEEIEVAIKVLGDGGLASVQNEFSPRFRNSSDELDYCGEQGIAFLPWSPLGGTGGGGREVGERFAVFSEIARGHGVSPQQVVLAWELSLGDHVIPIPGARRPESITDSAKAASLVLSDAELARCSASGGSMTSTASADVIIIGGGHNGLVAAAYLARAGRGVLVLEARDRFGGAVASEPVFAGVEARLSRFAYLVSLLPDAISLISISTWSCGLGGSRPTPRSARAACWWTRAPGDTTRTSFASADGRPRGIRTLASARSAAAGVRASCGADAHPAAARPRRISAGTLAQNYGRSARRAAHR